MNKNYILSKMSEISKYTILSIVTFFLLALPFHTFAKSAVRIIEEKREKSFQRICAAVATKYNMTCIIRAHLGIVGNDENFRGWGAVFNDNRQFTINQLRPLLLPIRNDLLTQMCADPQFDDYLAEESKNPTWRIHPLPNKMCKELIGYKIAFWDQNVERPPAPYVSEVRVFADKVQYYDANPKDQSLHLVLEEPLEK